MMEFSPVNNSGHANFSAPSEFANENQAKEIGIFLEREVAVLMMEALNNKYEAEAEEKLKEIEKTRLALIAGNEQRKLATAAYKEQLTGE